MLFFERHLEDNLCTLHNELVNKTYQHGTYDAFYVNDPKQRHIHKASVKDRVVHHVLYTLLYKVFDPICIYDSYSCRLNKGTHKAVKRLEKFTQKVSHNYIRLCWGLKCDVAKFFASVDHATLKHLLKKRIKDDNILWLLEEVIDSFSSNKDSGPRQTGQASKAEFDSARMTPHQGYTGQAKRGIPLGNLTSQVFANIYLNELDQFVKHTLKVTYYLRYADDFLFLSENRQYLSNLIEPISLFLQKKLELDLHPRKVVMSRLDRGIDFLGYIVLPHYRLPRTKTKRRMFTKLNKQNLQSYLGYLQHANTHELSQRVKNEVFFTAH